MEGFDAMTMQSYLAGPMPASAMLQLDSLDQHQGYKQETYGGSEDASQYGQYQPQTAPTIKRLPSGFDDAFSDVISTFDPSVTGDHPVADAPHIEHDHQLLSFASHQVPLNLLDYAYRPVDVGIQAQLHGMFFLAESAVTSAGEGASPQAELTCYRRNLFQVTGNLTLARAQRFVITEKGEQMPIISQELTITANETVEGNSVKLICVPWKTPITSAPVPEDKGEKEPVSIPIDLSQEGPGLDGDYVSIPIAWKRLQFRIATANNGRRKELQQHFIVWIKLMATLADGSKVEIAQTRSGPIIVRGRSPRNFQSRKDMPISGSGSFSRRREQMARTSAAENHPVLSKPSPPATTHALDLPQVPFTFEAPGLALSPDFFEWRVPNNNNMGAMTAMPGDYSIQHSDAANVYAQSTPDLARSVPHSRPARAPIALSLAEDDSKPIYSNGQTGQRRKTASASPVATPLKRAKTHHAPTSARAPSFSLGSLGAVDESADTLYEYFPLGVDDWLPPVDAVYRPHVVHHTNLPADPKDIRDRSKRYFSEVQTA